MTRLSSLLWAIYLVTAAFPTAAMGQDLKKIIALQQAQIKNLQERLDRFAVYNVSPDNPTTTPDKEGTWQTIDGMTKDFELKAPARVVMMYSLVVSTIESGFAQWVGTRLVIDGKPLYTSGRHTQPAPNAETPASSDYVLAAQDVQEMPAGAHKVELQWRSNYAIWKNHGKEWYEAYGGIGGRTMTVMVFPK